MLFASYLSFFYWSLFLIGSACTQKIGEGFGYPKQSYCYWSQEPSMQISQSLSFICKWKIQGKIYICFFYIVLYLLKKTKQTKQKQQNKNKLQSQPGLHIKFQDRPGVHRDTLPQSVNQSINQTNIFKSLGVIDDLISFLFFWNCFICF